MRIVEKIKDIFSFRLTFMLIPHGSKCPRQISVHLSFLLFVLLTWTGITFWGSYLSAQHVDYWRSELSNQVLKMKIKYMVAQVEKSREYIDQVKAVEGELRQLLKHQNEASIIRADQPIATVDNPEASGGPTMIDQVDLTMSIKKLDDDMTWQYLFAKTGMMKMEAKQQLSSYQQLSSWIETQRRVFRATPRGWPCDGNISSKYGPRASPFGGGIEYHPGVDISGPLKAPIRATADGVVKMASWNSGYGNLVVLQHEFGYSTRYAHNNRILVRVGERVKRGQVLALMGATGRASGVHCHYEVWRYTQRLNPLAFLRDDTKPVVAAPKETPAEPAAENPPS